MSFLFSPIPTSVPNEPFAILRQLEAFEINGTSITSRETGICSNLLRCKTVCSSIPPLSTHEFHFSMVSLQTTPRSFLELTTSQCIASITEV